MRALAVLSVLALCVAPAMAQHQHGGTTTQALELHPGLGNYHHPITTQNPEAQTYFNQGLDPALWLQPRRSRPLLPPRRGARS